MGIEPMTHNVSVLIKSLKQDILDQWSRILWSLLKLSPWLCRSICPAASFREDLLSGNSKQVFLKNRFLFKWKPYSTSQPELTERKLITWLRMIFLSYFAIFSFKERLSLSTWQRFRQAAQRKCVVKLFFILFKYRV